MTTDDVATASTEPARRGAPSTGVTSVDEVILAVEHLEERPIEEHVGVFETAHAELRRALDEAAEGPEDPDHPAG